MEHGNTKQYLKRFNIIQTDLCDEARQTQTFLLILFFGTVDQQDLWQHEGSFWSSIVYFGSPQITPIQGQQVPRVCLYPLQSDYFTYVVYS